MELCVSMLLPHFSIYAFFLLFFLFPLFHPHLFLLFFIYIFFFLSSYSILLPPLLPSRVNALLPGFIDTPMTTPFPDKYRAGLIDIIPFKRFGCTKGELFVFLFSFLISLFLVCFCFFLFLFFRFCFFLYCFHLLFTLNFYLLFLSFFLLGEFKKYFPIFSLIATLKGFCQ